MSDERAAFEAWAMSGGDCYERERLEAAEAGWMARAALLLPAVPDPRELTNREAALLVDAWRECSPIADGWRLVPEEPTEAMLKAAIWALDRAKEKDGKLQDPRPYLPGEKHAIRWRAMLEAAPVAISRKP
jgi:hypothetical protein